MSNRDGSIKDNEGRVVAAIMTDLGYQIVIESYAGNKYKSSNMPGVSYLQEPYFQIKLLQYDEGNPVDTSCIWVSSNDMRKLLSMVKV